MEYFKDFVGQFVNVEISGGKCFRGNFIDFGLDIVVIYNEKQFLYIPLVHIQNLTLSSANESDIVSPPEAPIDNQAENISYRKILNNAKGRFLEIYVTGNKAIHGYLTSVMNDYFVFHSIVYKSIFVSLNHLKWLIPYHPDVTPYSLNRQSIPFNPPPTTLSRTFKEQCTKLQGNMVVFDLGDNPNKIGLLQTVNNNNNMLELITANGAKVYWNLQHLKTVNIA
ncbi:DUF2642 domain-containing protein [Effusibacillus dendaii]|uniref:DUF2642 domain-containing protein n=1 Tax=Effusibacillus dendaii TaxID=2743772 RepID=A0A7I8DE68_9BACL|nr:DUF2642 domain-containing protein [Effusibacillus dendaii]BCJ88327.1 hypothetical protein skT53_33120 [Effusibacillus dendaii]